ncbi:MAG: hypothetical protein GX242_00095 [Clostridiales bacterium]|nr:hypothetical protein [Clostridiales bacterium]
MCAEVLPWKCHRSIISNTLTILGIEVYHIKDDKSCAFHHLNKYGATAIQKDGKLIYPKVKS